MAEVSAEAVSSPQVQEVFRVQAALPVKGTPEEMRRFIATDRERWASVVKDLNIRLE
jgi:tripartite-type tricarboxylate transporter receptor subunit TctC